MKTAKLNYCGSYLNFNNQHRNPHTNLIPTGRWKVKIIDEKPYLYIEIYAEYSEYVTIVEKVPVKFLGIFPTTMTEYVRKRKIFKTDPEFIKEQNLTLSIIEEFPVQSC